MFSPSQYQLAVLLAVRAHDGQHRHDGKTPYVTHPLEVSFCFSDPMSQTIAVLHDVLEDTAVTYEELERLFGTVVASTVRVLSRQKDEAYTDFITRVSRHSMARDIKIADIEHNLPTSSEGMQHRYKQALAILRMKI